MSSSIIIHTWTHKRENEQSFLFGGTGSVKVKSHQPQRALTPGQAAVFYRDDLVPGGGRVAR
jgi:tRNA-specific 2-thiouridylase